MENKIKKDNYINKIGLIGLGRWGKNIVLTCKNIPEVKLKYVASKNRSAIEFIPSDCRIFQDWQDMINIEKLDGVIICTPPRTHFEIAIKFIKAGIPVLIEKPLTLDLNEARNIYKISKEKQVLVMTDFIYLFNYKFNALKNSLKIVGDIKYISTQAGNFGPYREDTPVLWDWGAHDLSILLSILGESPKKIYTRKIKENTKTTADESIWQINCSFNNQIKSSTLIGNMMPKCRKIGVLGTEGMIVFDDIETTPLKFYRQWKYHDFPIEGGTIIPVVPDKKPLNLIIESFSSLINKGINSHWSLSMGVEVCRLLEESSSI